jgi:5-methylcytosine-specific restriction endonuclease McrA
VYEGETREYAQLVRRDPCSYCGAPGGQADHIEPVSLGGENLWENLTGACVMCNRTKKTRTLLTFMLERVA